MFNYFSIPSDSLTTIITLSRTVGVLYNEENTMLETAFKSSVDVAKVKMAGSGVQLDVVSQIVPLYDSFETQHLGKQTKTYRKIHMFFQ